MKQHLIILTLILALITISFIPQTKATDVITIFTVPTTGSGGNLSDEHPSDSAYYSALGNCFIAQNSANLSYVNIKLTKFSSPTSTLWAWVAPTTGDVSDDSARPDGVTVYEKSMNSHAASSISTTATWYTFNFNQSTYLEAGQEYAIYVTATGDNVDTTNLIQNIVWSTGTNATYVGYTNSAWVQAVAGYSMTMEVYGISNLPDPTPTPTPTPSPSPVPDEITETWDLIDSLIGLLVPLLIILLPAFLGYKLAGAWGFLAGINIGAILAYAFMGADVFPLWGIIAILILDALLLFGKVGFRT